MSVAVDYRADNFAAAKLFNKLKCTEQSGHTHSGVKTLFKACGSICSHTESLCGGTNACAVKAGSLENNINGIVHNSAVLAAHNACNGNGLLSIGNYQHLFGKSSCYTVKGGYLLALCGISYLNGIALDVADIESVHRVTVFEHYKVCDINEIVDRTNAACTKSLSEPQRRGTYLNILYNACAVA